MSEEINKAIFNGTFDFLSDPRAQDSSFWTLPSGTVLASAHRVVSRAQTACHNFSQAIFDFNLENPNIDDVINKLRKVNYEVWTACRSIFYGQPTGDHKINREGHSVGLDRTRFPDANNASIYYITDLLINPIPELIYNNSEFIKTFGQTIWILIKSQGLYTKNIDSYVRRIVDIINEKTRPDYARIDCRDDLLGTSYQCGRALIYRNSLPSVDPSPRVIVFNTAVDVSGRITDNFDFDYMLSKYHKKYLKYKQKYLQLKNYINKN